MRLVLTPPWDRHVAGIDLPPRKSGAAAFWRRRRKNRERESKEVSKGEKRETDNETDDEEGFQNQTELFIAFRGGEDEARNSINQNPLLFYIITILPFR